MNATPKLETRENEQRELCEQLELSLPNAQALLSPRTRQPRRQSPSTR